MNSHNQRYSIRNLAIDLATILQRHKNELLLINKATKNGDFNGEFKKYKPHELLTLHQQSRKYTELQVFKVAQQLYDEMAPVFYNYGVRMTDVVWKENFEGEDLSFDDSLTLLQFMVLLMKTIIPKDIEFIEYHLVKGHYLMAYQRLNEVIENPSLLPNDLLFNVYQKSLNQVMGKIDKPGELTTQFKHIQTLISKERPRKPLRAENDSTKLLCPFCENELLKKAQHYCHQCGQRFDS